MANKERKRQALERQRRRRVSRAIAFGAIVVGVLLLAGFLLKARGLSSQARALGWQRH